MPSAPPFHSARLVYRAYTDSDSPLLEQMYADPTTLALGLGDLCVPQSPAALLEMGQGAVKGCLLSVVACLPLSADEPTKPGTPIGWINLGPEARANGLHRKASIGVVFLPEQQGKGYGTEAVAWLLAVAFERAGLHRVELECSATNAGARRVYEKCGFVLEGTRRRSMWNAGEWQDECFYAILADEWRSGQSAN